RIAVERALRVPCDPEGAAFRPPRGRVRRLDPEGGVERPQRPFDFARRERFAALPEDVLEGGGARERATVDHAPSFRQRSSQTASQRVYSALAGSFSTAAVKQRTASPYRSRPWSDRPFPNHARASF